MLNVYFFGLQAIIGIDFKSHLHNQMKIKKEP